MGSALRVVLAMLLLASAVAPTSAQDDQTVVGNPVLAVFAPENVLVPGEEGFLDIYIANTGSVDRGGPASYQERVVTARATTLELQSGDTPVTIETARFPVGIVPPGTHGPYRFAITVDEDAAPGTYEIPVIVSYTYTHIVRYDATDPLSEPRFSDWDTTKRLELRVRVEDRPRFAVRDVENDVQVGSRGTVSLHLVNDGTQTARDAVVTVASTDPEVRFAENATTAEAFVPSWEPGETRRVEYAVTVAPEAVQRAYPLRVVVDYRDPDGVARTSRVLAASVIPEPRQTFELQNVSDTIRVGARGRLTGEVVNTGTRTVAGAVLSMSTVPAPLTPVETEYPLGELAPGERVPFEFVVIAPTDADAGPRRFGFVVEFETPTATDAVSEQVDVYRVVSPRQDVFDARAVDATFEVDSDNRLEVVLTNTGVETLSDVRATLTVGDPLTSDAPESFVGRLAPGESASVAFQVTVDDDAIETTYPATVTVMYDDERGDTLTSKPLLVGVDIVEPRNRVPLVALVGVVLAVLVGSGWWWIRR